MYHTLKNSGLSSFYLQHYLQQEALNHLYELVCLPIVESSVDKFSFGFRPFRSSQDFYFKLKRLFSHNQKLSYLLTINVDFSFNKLNKFWLLKNFPFDKQRLSCWIDSYYESNIFNFFYKSSILKSTNIVFSFFNFILSGLV